MSHESTLIWTQKADHGPVHLVGLPEIHKIIKTGKVESISSGGPSVLENSIQSSRIALGFRYSTKHLFFSDRGFKRIIRAQLKVSYSF